MRVDPDSRSFQGLSTFLTFVALNVLYLLACLPVVTLGVATSALYEVTMRYSDDERGRPVADFVRALRTNLRPATGVSLLLLVPLGLLVFSASFWLSSGSALGSAAAALAVVASAYLLAAFLYGMALVARYRDTVRRTVRNALLLPAAEPVRTLGIVLVPVTLASITVVFPSFLVIVLTVGFSVGAYATAFLFRSVFARHGE